MTSAQAIAAALRGCEHVISASAIGNRIHIVFPRERGGRSTMTLPEAKRLLARLTGTEPGSR